MKTTAIFLYVFLSTLYLTPIADSSYFWGGLNLITQSAFICYLCYLNEDKEDNIEIERLLFIYVKWLSLANCLYILACMIRGKGFAIYNTDIFAYVTGIGFLVLMVHFALSKS